MIKFSEKRDKIAPALVAAQRGTAQVFKTTSGHNYKYGDLPAVLKAAKDSFLSNGISILQDLEDNKLHTLLQHESGQWASSVFPIVDEPGGRLKGMQQLGSATSYARRYSLMALAAIAPDADGNRHLYDDDDGAAASGSGNGSGPSQGSSSFSEAAPAEMCRGGQALPITLENARSLLGSISGDCLSAVEAYRLAAGLPTLSQVGDLTRGAFMSQLFEIGRGGDPVMRDPCYLWQMIKDLSTGHMIDEELILYARGGVGHMLDAIETQMGQAYSGYNARIVNLLEYIGSIEKSQKVAEMCALYDELKLFLEVKTLELQAH